MENIDKESFMPKRTPKTFYGIYKSEKFGFMLDEIGSTENAMAEYSMKFPCAGGIAVDSVTGVIEQYTVEEMQELWEPKFEDEIVDAIGMDYLLPNTRDRAHELLAESNAYAAEENFRKACFNRDIL